MNYELFIIIPLFIALIFFVIHLYRISSSIREINDYLKELLSGNFNARLLPSAGRNLNLDDVGRDIVAIVEKMKTMFNFAKAEAQRMEAVLRGMSDGVLIVNKQGVVILANQVFSSLLLVPDKDNGGIEGKQVIEVLRNIQLIEILKQAMDSENVISEEIAISRHSGDIHLVITAVPVFTRHEVTIRKAKQPQSVMQIPNSAFVSGAALVLHDITRLKQLEEVRKDFVANVSHEIKTPITAINGFAETLIDGTIVDDKDTACRFLGMIKDHSERLNSLVDDLLTLSGIELGDIAIKKIGVNLEQVIDTVFMTIEEKANKKGIYLKKVIPKDMQTIDADRDRLIQIILNLVDNGIKFTEKGGVTVGIDETGGRVTLYVQDTGIGVPQNHLQRLGERFYRVDRARSRELGGTGLGLAIVKHLIKAHDWDIRVESEPGKGTRVNIIIAKYL